MRKALILVTAGMVVGWHLPAVAQQVAIPTHDVEGSPFSGPTLGETALQAVAGREDTTLIARNDQVAGVSQNSVGDNAVTGEVRIDGNAFQNMSGLSILNVNTGNNVAINAAMNVNISITPGR